MTVSPAPAVPASSHGIAVLGSIHCVHIEVFWKMQASDQLLFGSQFQSLSSTMAQHLVPQIELHAHRLCHIHLSSARLHVVSIQPVHQTT